MANLSKDHIHVTLWAGCRSQLIQGQLACFDEVLEENNLTKWKKHINFRWIRRHLEKELGLILVPLSGLYFTEFDPPLLDLAPNRFIAGGSSRKMEGLCHPRMDPRLTQAAARLGVLSVNGLVRRARQQVTEYQRLGVDSAALPQLEELLEAEPATQQRRPRLIKSG